jgi:hypothetical protein
MPRGAFDYPPSSVIYADLREKWKHEDDLINQRVTWLLTSQGFLLTAFGVIAKLRLDEEKSVFPITTLARFTEKVWALYSVGELLIVVGAVVVTFFLKEGIVAAALAMREIKADLVRHKRARRVWRGIKVDILKGTTRAGASPAQAMAKTFLSVWALGFWYESYRFASIARTLLLAQ